MNDTINPLSKTIVFDGFTIEFRGGQFVCGKEYASSIESLIRTLQERREAAARDAEYRAEQKAKEAAAAAKANRPVLNKDTRGPKPVRPVLEAVGDRAIYEPREERVYTGTKDERGYKETKSTDGLTQIRITGVRRNASSYSYRNGQVENVWRGRLMRDGKWDGAEQVTGWGGYIAANEEEKAEYLVAVKKRRDLADAFASLTKSLEYSVHTSNFGRQDDYTTSISEPGARRSAPAAVEIEHGPAGLVLVDVTKDGVTTTVPRIGLKASDGTFITAESLSLLTKLATLHEAELFGLVDVKKQYSSTRWILKDKVGEYEAAQGAWEEADGEFVLIRDRLSLRLSEAVTTFADALDDYKESLSEWQWAGKQ